MEIRPAQLLLPLSLGRAHEDSTAPGAQMEGDGAFARPVVFVGLCAFSAVMQLFENLVVLQSTNAFNSSLYTILAQVLLLAVLGVVGFARSWTPPRSLVLAVGVLAALGALAAVTSFSAGIGCAGAVVAGFGMAVLSVAWGGRLSALPPRRAALQIFAALFVGAVVCFICFLMPEPVATCVLLVGMLLACLPWVALAEPGEEELPEEDERAVGCSASEKPFMYGVPVSALVALGVCCLVCAFFAGATMNPYAIQSLTVARTAHAVTLCAFAAGTSFCFALGRFSIAGALLTALALLLAGLLLLSTGVAGTVVVPIGVIGAARTALWGVALVVLTGIASAHPGKATGIFGVGLLVCNGAFGRGAGMLAGNAQASFADLATIGIVAIVAMAFMYAFTAASPRGTSMVGSGFDMGVKLALQADAAEALAARNELGDEEEKPDMFPGYDLSEREEIVARLIVEGRTYGAIAEYLQVSPSTVKFHAANIYRKTQVSSKSEFREKFKQP